MLGALVPEDVRPIDPPCDLDVPLDRVGFYVPPYMGAEESLELMSAMPCLEVVQLLTAGYESALQHVPAGIVLCNAAGVHDASTAELAVGLVLASLRGIDDFARAMPSGEWRSHRHQALADKHVLVIGAGGVGTAIARRIEPFEATVTLVGRTARPGVRAVRDLPGLLPSADVVILAVPLTDDSARLVDLEFLARLPDGSLVVNVARGGVVDTDALLAEVSSGRLRAALDVTDPEPLPPDHPMWRLPGVLVSPHVGGNTSAFLPRARHLVELQLARWAAGTPLQHVVSTGTSRNRERT